MKLNHGAHLAYCTNIHRGQNWRETLESLQKYALAVRREACPRGAFAIGLRLGSRAARELASPQTLRKFKGWLDKNDCYVFTVNGFPYGRFHGAAVKENVYRPDWTSPDRVAYTNLLFDLMAELVPEGVEGSVSTLPGSFKAFIKTGASGSAQRARIRRNLWKCVEHIARLSERTGKKLHLGLEPEPLCLLENSAETITFFEEMRAEYGKDARARSRLKEFLGVNYDCCHFAVEYEEPRRALEAFQRAGIRISKLHLSSALKMRARALATRGAVKALRKFASDEVYLHQVIARVRGRNAAGKLEYFRDLPEALKAQAESKSTKLAEWRIHFHVPLHARAMRPFENTNDHLLGALDWLAKNPRACSHLEMETYTWEVLPRALKSRSVVRQLAAEYAWTLGELGKRGMV